MPFSSSGLRRELLSGFIYSGKIATGDHAGLAADLNKIPLISGSQNIVSTQLSGMTWRHDVEPREVINVILPTDFRVLQQIQLSKMNVLFQAAPIDTQLSGIRQNFSEIFSGSASMLSGGLAAMSQRPASRSELLFGAGVSVSTTQVQQALISG
jgi:hypothetical protein